MRVLIVEDDPISRELLKRILSPYGDCTLCVDGREAVAAFRNTLETGSRFDLVCLDIMMPEMDGQEALKEIRRLERDKGIARSQESVVIMTTALDTPKDVIEAYYRGGCTSYLVKPINQRKLLNVIQELGLLASE
ncbi:MAG: response regulator [Acidobacteria bacterium]|nr:response regulator [Acidobacteriota bacterium]